jgi:hypothetical protein
MRQRRNREGGFALLLVFAMASIIAISLYYSLPRVAFEAQRDKEQTLIDRGEQYKRAVQLYVRKNKRWPAKVEDLESSNGLRFLRRRYVDPMTGKDEWRAVHVGPTGVLTDSLVKPVGKDNKEEKGVNNFITELKPLGETADPAGNTNPGLRKRPSDQSPTGGPLGDPTSPGGTTGFPNEGLQAGAGQPNGQGTPQQSNPQPGSPQPGLNGLPQQLQTPGGQTPPPAANMSGGISVLGGVGSGYSTAAGANGATPPPVNAQNAGQTVAGQGQIPGPGGLPGAPGAVPGQPNSAAALIQNLLTSPRPGGAPPGVGTAQANTSMGSGIAGFASKFEGSAIKSYKEQDEYQKWEFVYDMSKDAAVTGGQNAIPQVAGPQGTPIGGAQGQQSQSQTGFGTGSSFGQSGNTPATGTPATGTGTTRPQP